jgi:hypothetical protein
MSDTPSDPTTREPDPPARQTGQAPQLTVRLIMPDRWLEHVAELPATTTLAEAKQLGLQAIRTIPTTSTWSTPRSRCQKNP